MTLSEAKLLEEALKLSPEARAAQAGSLLDSLEDPPEPDAEALWEAEINQRTRDIELGTARMVPWPEAHRAILGREMPTVRFHSDAVAEYGGGANGLTEWRTQDGTHLKELNELA